jgi:hypothetical protein
MAAMVAVSSRLAWASSGGRDGVASLPVGGRWSSGGRDGVASLPLFCLFFTVASVVLGWWLVVVERLGEFGDAGALAGGAGVGGIDVVGLVATDAALGGGDLLGR